MLTFATYKGEKADLPIWSVLLTRPTTAFSLLKSYAQLQPAIQKALIRTGEQFVGTQDIKVLCYVACFTMFFLQR